MTRNIDNSSAAVNQMQQNDGGVFTLGGRNESYFTGEVEFHNVTTGSGFWAVGISSTWFEAPACCIHRSLSPIGLSIQGVEVSVSEEDGKLAAVDTGTTLIGGPTAVVSAFWNAVPGSAPISNLAGHYAFRKFFACAFTSEYVLN